MIGEWLAEVCDSKSCPHGEKYAHLCYFCLRELDRAYAAEGRELWELWGSFSVYGALVDVAREDASGVPCPASSPHTTCLLCKGTGVVDEA